MDQIPQHQRQTLPNSRNILILGIITFACGVLGFAFFPAVVSILLGIVESVLIIKTHKKIKADPRQFTPHSLGVRRAGVIFALIGLTFAILFIALWVNAYFTDSIYFGNPNK